MKRPSKQNLEEERAIKEKSRRFGRHEYQIADDAHRFVPVCNEANGAKCIEQGFSIRKISENICGK